jgi:hypothetical protein
MKKFVDIIKSFGRFLFCRRDNVLARIIIKARVTDLANVPHYIIISEGDFFEGVSLIAQCEIISKTCWGACHKMRIPRALMGILCF